MMERVFKFTDYNVDVKIGDKAYTVDTSSDTGDELMEISDNLKKLSEEIKKGAKTRDAVINYGLRAIDKLLGKGAAEEIFKDRKTRLADILDVLKFISGVIAETAKERKNKYEK